MDEQEMYSTVQIEVYTNTILFFRKHKQAKFISFYHQWTMERRVNAVRMGELWYDLAVERLKHFRMLHT